ncbi:MAG TPA: TetR/AcrR family transcriptional regulator [Mycobacteriales bacterium]|nr:TetR/AcrR family transcriptional regulator [Mycobacteriales bacterium]HVX70973.1 TetR/AcrR family transcriptional regulator [Mycobacteriales bacterium]
MTTTSSELDGRRARRGRNREAVVDALLELFREGELNPSVAAVAERSGVSLRSVFRYFDDLDEMGRIAIQRHLDSVGHLFELPNLGEGPRAARIDALVSQRIDLYERVAPVMRAALIRAPFQTVIAKALRRRREFLRDQVHQQFATELSGLPAAEAAVVLAGADVLTSFESMELLRVDHKLTTAKAAAAIKGSLDRLLPG